MTVTDFTLDDPRLDFATPAVREAVGSFLREQDKDFGALPAGTRLVIIGVAWKAVLVALEALDSEQETAEILGDPVTMGRLGEAQAELTGNADAVTAIVRATGGTAFYAADGEAMIVADAKGRPRQLISVCGHGSPVAAPLGAWEAGYRS